MSAKTTARPHDVRSCKCCDKSGCVISCDLINEDGAWIAVAVHGARVNVTAAMDARDRATADRDWREYGQASVELAFQLVDDEDGEVDALTDVGDVDISALLDDGEWTDARERFYQDIEAEARYRRAGGD